MILRFAIIISFILSVGAALGSFTIFSSYQTERQLRLDAESKMIQVQDSVSSTSRDNEQQLARMEELEADLNRLKTEQTALESAVEAKSIRVEDLEAELSSKESEIKSLNQKIESMKPVLVSAPPVSVPPVSALVVSKSDVVTSPSAVVSSPTSAPAVVAQPVNNAKETSTSSAPVASSALQSETAGDSRVLTVNRKFNFVVVNLGLKDGLRMGDKVEVVQGSSQKALAQVEKIYDKFSAATLLSEDKGNPVHEGDTVRKL